MNLKALFFDLDGTIIHTIPDISDALNDALKAAGFPYRYSVEETKRLVGYGSGALIHRALQEMDSPENFEKLKKEYMLRYRDYQTRHSDAFPGLKETLRRFKERGLVLFVCSNKPHPLAVEIVEHVYGKDFFLEIYGDKAGEAPKPDPHILLHFMKKYDLKPEECLMIGDSLPDVLTAENAGVKCLLCTWGYGLYDEELLARASKVAHNANELEKKILG